MALSLPGGDMERFIRRENVKHYRDMLKAAKSEAERNRLRNLLAEEETKQSEAGDFDLNADDKGR